MATAWKVNLPFAFSEKVFIFLHSNVLVQQDLPVFLREGRRDPI